MRGGRTVEVTKLARFLEKWVVLVVCIGGEIFSFWHKSTIWELL